MTDRTTLDAGRTVRARQLQAGDWLGSAEWPRERKVVSADHRSVTLVDFAPGRRTTRRRVQLPADVVVTKKGERDDEA